MIGILHGYLLEGSGSNLWTRSIAAALCRAGKDVHLVAQENHPAHYDFVTEARRYLPDGSVETWFRQETPYPGACILHKPVLGDLLPVYVWDRYEEFTRVVPMVELTDEEIESYLEVNTRALLRIVEEHRITALHANHSVMMSVVARRVSEATGIPFAVMPHGSALEYAVKRDPRFRRMAAEAFRAARRVFVIGDELRERVREALPGIGLDEKVSELHLGVDTGQFEPLARGERRANVDRLAAALSGRRRGKTDAQSAGMLARLDGAMGEEELRALFADAQDYDGKSPDAGVEARLHAVDWERDRVLLFVGRLISTKGVHGVIAALPLLLERHPELRLVVVGHGPLREPLEALLWALEHGERALVESIASRGRVLEGSPEGESGGTELTQVARYLEWLDERGERDAYFAAARRHLRPDRVVFTGYLTHRELRYLFPCCDAAVFPSVVREAGPLVFLEALASGSFPLGTYFGGMRASIDSLSDVLPPEAVEAMKLDPAPEGTVRDIVAHVPAALELGERHKETLHRVARERYDWASVARKLYLELESM